METNRVIDTKHAEEEIESLGKYFNTRALKQVEVEFVCQQFLKCIQGDAVAKMVKR